MITFPSVCPLNSLFSVGKAVVYTMDRLRMTTVLQVTAFKMREANEGMLS